MGRYNRLRPRVVRTQLGYVSTAQLNRNLYTMISWRRWDSNPGPIALCGSLYACRLSMVLRTPSPTTGEIAPISLSFLTGAKRATLPTSPLRRSVKKPPKERAQRPCRVNYAASANSLFAVIV